MSIVDENGWVESDKVCVEHRQAIEHGELSEVKAIVLHQTGASTAKSTLEAWKNKAEGAHFLISESGEIYQCASLKKKCWHVGQIYARCEHANSCSKEDAEALEAILKKKNTSWGTKFKLVTQHELKKSYPERYPHNHDSLGIEVVGAAVNGKYQESTQAQLDSAFWLIDALVCEYSLGVEHIYAHGKIAHKEETEGTYVLKAFQVYKERVSLPQQQLRPPLFPLPGAAASPPFPFLDWLPNPLWGGGGK